MVLTIRISGKSYSGKDRISKKLVKKLNIKDSTRDYIFVPRGTFYRGAARYLSEKGLDLKETLNLQASYDWENNRILVDNLTVR